MQGVYYMVQNRMQEMRKIVNYVYFIYSTICILKDRLYSATEELEKLLLKHL